VNHEQPQQPRTLRALAEDVVAARTDRREFFRRAAALGVSVPAASALLAACSGSNSATSSSGAATSKGGTLTYGPLGDGENYDPLLNNYDYPSPPFPAIYEGLTTYPPGAQWTAKNLLAESLERSADGKTYKFKLKPNIHFHHGFGELTASEVKYSFERAASIQPLYPNAPKSAVSYYAGDFPNLIGVKVTSKYEGEIRFKEPFAPLETITLPFATSGYIVPQKAVVHYGSKFPQHPIGTGPYEVASYTPNQEMVLQRFADYGGADSDLNVPKQYDEIKMVLTPLNALPKGESLTVALQSGQADFTTNLGQLDVNRLKGNSSFTTYAAPAGLNYFFLSIDVKNPKLQNVKVRQAIRAALDIPQVIQANRMPADTRLNALISKAEPVGYWAEAPVYSRNVAQARQLLSEAGVSKLTLDIATPSISTTPGEPNQVMQLIQSNLKDAGITLNIIETPPDAYVAKAGFGDLAWTSFGGAPDPYYQFEWFTCSQLGVWNYASWCNTQYTSLEGQMATEADNAKRGQIAVEMQKLMDEDVPYVWISTQVVYAASKSSVKAVFDANGNPQLSYFTTS
jgi:peptide/nickel transport system substrate-binding protein